MSRTTVAVIFGGCSSEYEISLLSASSVIRNIPKDKYEIIMLGITKEGHWLLFNGDVDEIENGTWEKHSENRTAFLSPDRGIHGIVMETEYGFSAIRIDVIFPVLHGKNGEDGTIQGLFQLSGIPFVGCDTLASAVCMDKAVTNILLEAAGIDQANFMWFYASDYENVKEQVKEDIMADLGGYPVFVKPANAGSSVGVSKAKNAAELDKAVAIAAKEDKKIVIEECIVGKEVECAVMGNAIPKVSVVGEIAPSAEFYDYEDKYKNGTSKVYIPAPLDDELSAEICNTAAKAYRALGCSGLSRVDFFVRDSDNAVLLNEINTLPGFTSISMYSMLWKACGIDYGHLLDHIIQFAFDK